MKLGKKFIREYIISQLRFFNNWADTDRVDIIMHGKLLGFAEYDWTEDGCISCVWGDYGEVFDDCRASSRKLRANIRWFVNDLTNAIYAKGLKHNRMYGKEWFSENNRFSDKELIDAAIDEEISLANDVREDIEGKETEFDYYDMVNVIRLEGNPRKSHDDDAVSDLIDGNANN